MCEVCVCRDRVYFYTEVFKCSVLVLEVFKLSWADECEVSWVEADNAPFTFEVVLCNFEEFTCLEC